jgi:hypothetical protein
MILLEISFQVIGYAVMFMLMVAIAWLLAEFHGMKEEIRNRLGINNETIKLRLQAYERLTLFCERAGLQNLVGRISSFNQNSASLQAVMTESIRSEYDYNLSQQIYVGKEVWKAITKLRDQNIFIINQVAATLPPDAPGIELSRRILEYCSNENAELNVFVIDALKIESKKLL